MNLKAVIQLAKTNLIYATPPIQLVNYRKKQAKNLSERMDIPKKIFYQQLLIGTLYIFLFVITGAFSGVVGKSPGLFANFITLFSLFTFSQSFIALYNVFYESHDLDAYRPYAFRESEIILGKSVSVLVTAMIGLGPLIGYFVIFPFQVAAPVWKTVPLMLCNLALLLVFLALFTFVVTHYLTRLPLFRRYKDILANILLTVISASSGGLYVFINYLNAQASVAGGIPAYVPPFAWFYEMMLHPLSPTGLMGYLSWGGATLCLFGIVYYRILPRFYDTVMDMSGKNRYRRRVRSMQLDRNYHSIRRYQRSLLKEASVWTQIILPAALLPYLFCLPIVLEVWQSPNLLEKYVQIPYLLPLLLIVVMIAFFNSTGVNLTSIGFSLERENFDYLCVLPIRTEHYVKEKFWLFFFIQSIVPLTFLVVVGFLVRLPLLVFVALIVSWSTFSFAFSSWSYLSDYRQRVTNWSNLVELQNRYRRFSTIIGILVLLVLIMIMIVILYFVFSNMPAIIGKTIGGVAWILFNTTAMVFGIVFQKILTEELS